MLYIDLIFPVILPFLSLLLAHHLLMTVCVAQSKQELAARKKFVGYVLQVFSMVHSMLGQVPKNDLWNINQ
jgi:hypothetical protein